MKPQLVLTTLSLFFFATMGTGCVSIDIKPPSTTKADDFKIKDPISPFGDISAGEADQAWQSGKTGNTIAVLTECNSSVEPSLKSLENETLAAMSNTEVLSSEKEVFKGHEALKTLVNGQVDGVSIQVLLFSFKKTNCSYTLTYLGRKESFPKEIPIFEKFIQGFEFE